MSLCNTFRLSVACCIVVLSNIDAPVVALSLHRAKGAIDIDRHLAQEESVQLEIKRELHVPDTIPLNESTTIKDYANNDSFVPTNPSIKLEQVIPTEPYTEKRIDAQTINIPNVTLIQEQTIDKEKEVTTDGSDLVTNSELQTVTTSFDVDYTTSALVDKVIDIETTTSFIDIQTASEINIDDTETTELAQLEPAHSNKTTTQDEIKIKQKLTELEKLKNKIKVHKSRPMPKWKKYKIIERKRPSHSAEEDVKEEKRKATQKEDILKAETQNVRVKMQDPATSKIPSIESSATNVKATESEDGVTFMVTEQSASTTDSLMPSVSPTETISQISHESKRAGFLNYSGKTTTEKAPETTTIIDIPSDTTTKEVTTIAGNPDLKTNEQRIAVKESPLEDKKNIDSQIVLNEDAIKEEFLKEQLINNNKENAKRQREEAFNNKSDPTENKNENQENSTETNASSEISAKSKNNTLYTVSPNYKPMKKIEVVPPKQFVRDPDDNSWRNESLSSLGIVFKPKNSSKPFTQVLKNKTETEWNNLSEKDSKNDLPDLKERLQKETQKRKSKRKKTDSFGNVYFDYEENSNSAEHAGVTIDSHSSVVTTNSPILQSTNPENGSPHEAPQNVSKNVSSILTTEGVHRHRFTTSIPKFLHEYYDTDEDDSDYLNMAQIDLKKFTTSLRTSTPFHPSTIVAKQPDWPKQNNKMPYSVFPERKATVQYFPPRTTQRVTVNDYDNGFNFKMEPFTTESVAPAHVSPASGEATTTAAPVNTVPSSEDYTKNLLLTQSQITTESGLPLNDGSFDRGTYVIKHYKDFVNEAAKHAEYDKNIEYIPYTEAPVEGVTKAQLIDYETLKPKAIDNEYDYDAQFRKDVLQRFVENFNQNTDQYRSDFPILFNSSIIHRGIHNNGDIASSRAFMRSSYNNDLFKPKFTGSRKACEPNCDKLSVELSPAYELHYYVPDQEEKEEVQPVTLPYQYR